ncbi:MAG: iron complex outermembrane receptor protein [Glaciecola sp.]
MRITKCYIITLRFKWYSITSLYASVFKLYLQVSIVSDFPKYRALSLASLLFSASFYAQAQTLSGVVVNKLGEPLKDGSVQIMGTNLSADIQANGSFIFEDVKPGDIEVHVASSTYIHSKTELSIPESGLFDVEIIVEKSSIEIFDVTASAFHASTIESAAPVSVISGDELRKKQASTLGDTLKNEVGVHSTFYGSVASSPIIRGLDGPRVLVTQNGLDSGDASRVGPDHVVATDASTATQIEVLRGPATLFYGSGAIGGVVNVVDQRIPDNNDWEGEVATDRNTNNSEETFSANLKGGKGSLAFNLQAFYRDADDYRIPGFAENPELHDDEEMHDEDEAHNEEAESKGVVENSASNSKGITVGASYLMENGHVGFSVEHLSSLYGVPGHAHSEDETVEGDLQQNRYQISSKHQLDSEWFSALNTGFAYTDYQHAEIEDGQIGTVFGNISQEARIELIHQTIAGWRGGFSFHYKASDFEAIGDEAFTPPSETRNFGLGIIEEQHFGDVLFQLGARIEKVKIDVPSIQLNVPEFIAEHSDAEHDEEAHDEEHEETADFGFLNSSSASFTPISASIGAVWDFTTGYNLGLSFVHAQRAPSSAEVYSFGPHIGTSTYEVGTFYTLNDEGEVALNESGLNVEKSNNIDISLRKFSGEFGFVLNAFYNQVQDYYVASNTSFVFEGEHEHDEHEELEEEPNDEHMHEAHEDELPVYLYSADDVDLYGFEAQLNWQATASLQIQAQADMVRSKLKEQRGNSRYLARTPPSRLGLSANYVFGNWQAELSLHRYFAQDRLAEFETATDAYSLLDLDLNYVTSYKNTDVTFYLKGRNLADEEARVHTSFLKDLTPVQGRSFVLGARLQF